MYGAARTKEPAQTSQQPVISFTDQNDLLDSAAEWLIVDRVEQAGQILRIFKSSWGQCPLFQDFPRSWHPRHGEEIRMMSKAEPMIRNAGLSSLMVIFIIRLQSQTPTHATSSLCTSSRNTLLKS